MEVFSEWHVPPRHLAPESQKLTAYLTVVRYDRTSDKILAGGLVANERKVPSFIGEQITTRHDTNTWAMSKMNEPELSEADIARRRDEALRRALNTPPQPKHGKKKESNPKKPNLASEKSKVKPDRR